MARLPTVESVSLSSGLPMTLFTRSQPFLVEGRPPPLPGKGPLRQMEIVSPEHFATLGMSLERGRGFRAGDGLDAQPVVIINRAMARALWPGQDPLGQRIGPAVGEPTWRTVVGVVSDVAVTDVREPITRFRTYEPLAQDPRSWVTLTVRARTSAPAAVVEIPEAVASVDPSLPAFEAASVRDSVDLSLANLTLLAWILLGFAALGLLLAALGLYGLFSDFVVQRTRESGCGWRWEPARIRSSGWYCAGACASLWRARPSGWAGR